ncbi:MAG: 50S ribosomal protein L21e [Candidatus Woesearchaeota archaeon]
MVKRQGGMRRKSRNIFSKKRREKGGIGVSKLFKDFKEGEKVRLSAEPSVHKGLYNRKFHSCLGIIKKKRGECYEVLINDHKAKKLLIIHPAHLKRVN